MQFKQMFVTAVCVLFLGTGHYLCGGGGGEVGGKSWGGPRPIFFKEKGWAKSEFNDGWGWVIVCFVKNHAHYIGDSVVDGATLHWEHYTRFQDMSEDSIANLTLQDYEKYEEQRKEKNAWTVASQLAERIDSAPVLSDYIHASVSERPEDSFF